MARNLQRKAVPDELEPHPANEGYAFKIAVVFQDELTQNWARQMCGEVTQKFGTEHVQNTWHDVKALGDPGIFQEAVQAALAADVIVVSVHAAAELPPELCAWITDWLPHRTGRAGALAALIGINDQPDFQAARTQEYLQGVARRGQLDFMPHERRLPPAHDVAAIRPNPGQAGDGRYFRLSPDGQSEFRF